jgi:hypothetical protein
VQRAEGRGGGDDEDWAVAWRGDGSVIEMGTTRRRGLGSGVDGSSKGGATREACGGGSEEAEPHGWPVMVMEVVSTGSDGIDDCCDLWICRLVMLLLIVCEIEKCW